MKTKITLGHSADWYRKELKRKGIFISTLAEEMLDKMPVGKKETIFVEDMKVSDLGFDSGYPTTKEILQRAHDKGYELCPAETGPALALAIEQESGSWIYVGMENIVGSDRRPGVFTVKRYDDGEQWLYADWTGPEFRWNLGSRVVFRLRKSLDTTNTVDLEENSGTLPSALPSVLTINGIRYRKEI